MSGNLPALEARDGAVFVKIRAAPGASLDRVVGVHGAALKVAVRAPPERGRANEAIALLLARHLGLKRSQVRLHSGGTSRDKWFRLVGAPLDAVKRRLQTDEP